VMFIMMVLTQAFSAQFRPHFKRSTTSIDMLLYSPIVKLGL
jgi:hypothetical protein